MSIKDPVEQNIAGVQSLVGSKLNKTSGASNPTNEGPEGEREDEFSISLTDDELLALAQQWTLKYAPYEAKIKLRQEKNKTFYLGLQKEGSPTVSEGPISANLLFEAEETFLPAALSKNPEPVVWSDDTSEGNKLATTIKTMLQYHADTLVLRRKLTLMVRHWSIYFIGVIKHGWDPVIGDIKSDIRDPQNFIFDPEGFIDPYGDYEGPLGERVSVSAAKLIELFPKFKDFIILSVDGKLGTKVWYTEWWNDDYFFYTYKGKVLGKNKNPHFNYDRTEKEIDLDGLEQEVEIKGSNHFARPKKPYTFLSVFTLGEQPHDVTNLIEQNIPNQRRITRRTEQIDYNLSRSNNSDVFSEENFTQETAKQAANALKVGNPVLVPRGKPIDQAIARLQGSGIDASYFNELENSKNDLRQIFGTQGITALQQDEDQTARGMILNQQYDNSRIGGGIGDALEQVADNIFNWWVQLYYVYYDEAHYGMVMGKMKAVEFVTLRSVDINKRLVISVSPNSMKPQDEITQMNQALTLWDKGAIDPKTLLTVLDFPDPQNTAAQAVLWRIDPNLYMQLNFPDLVQKLKQTRVPVVAPDGSVGAPAAGGVPPEAVTEPPPPEGVSVAPASPALNNVPINNLPTNA